jgi:hypothetical protein
MFFQLCADEDYGDGDGEDNAGGEREDARRCRLGGGSKSMLRRKGNKLMTMTQLSTLFTEGSVIRR